jgi:hypothetical protein
MRSRSFSIMTTLAGSALIGAGVAITGHLASIDSQSVGQAGLGQITSNPTTSSPPAPEPQQTAQIPAVSLIPEAGSQVGSQSGSQSGSQKVQVSALTSQPSFPLPPSPAPSLTAATPDPASVNSVPPNSISPLRAQLQRAIQERNFALLRSLMQAGSLRAALRDIEVKEQINFNNLDASTWTVLEKAIDYRCHQAQTSDTACFESLP